jgi:hypothetical protein
MRGQGGTAGRNRGATVVPSAAKMRRVIYISFGTAGVG